MHTSVNRVIACKPPARVSVEPTVKSGFATVKQKASLVALKVVFNYRAGAPDAVLSLSPGHTVQVLGDSLKLPWATTVYELDGVQFVLVPVEAIRLISVV